MIKIAAMIGAPDQEQETLAVYSGDRVAAFGEVGALGYDGVELMMKDPYRLDGAAMRDRLKENRLELAGLCTGHVSGEDGLGLTDLFHWILPWPDPDAAARSSIKSLRQFIPGFES